MSRHNTRNKLRQRIIKLFMAASRDLSTDDVVKALQEDANRHGYKAADFYKIRTTLGDLCNRNLLERDEPKIPRDAHIPSNRELQIMWAHYVTYRIPSLTRLAMLVDEKDEGEAQV